MGKNCEVDVDACALASSTCPPQTECVDLPHGLQYTCRVPCQLNLQVGSNHEHNLRVNISFVIITQPSFHASTRFVPNFHLKKFKKCQVPGQNFSLGSTETGVQYYISSVFTKCATIHSWTGTRPLRDKSGSDSLSSNKANSP